MKKIPLTKRKFALVDDSDYDLLIKFKWHYNDGYAMRWTKNGKVRMHRMIMDAPKNMDVDHEDHNGLNNQRYNLRVCTRSQNKMNSTKTKGESKFKGVSLLRRTIRGKEYKYFRSRILVNNKSIETVFPFSKEGELMAAKDYNEKAIKYFGDYANINRL